MSTRKGNLTEVIMKAFLKFSYTPLIKTSKILNTPKLKKNYTLTVGIHEKFPNSAMPFTSHHIR